MEALFKRLSDITTAAEFDKIIEDYKITNPRKLQNKLSKTYQFNLMFKTKIGPKGDKFAYLRPETAQSMFVNFKKLLNFNNGRLPFGASIIGNAYRNEIAPRNGLIRVREFEQAEIEYFIDPLNKKHEKFSTIAGIKVPLFDRKSQLANKDA